MTPNFENLTCLDHDDLNRFALSLAASECAFEDNDPNSATRKFAVAQTLRRLEEAEMDGAISPVLEELRQKASVLDNEEGEYRAHYLLRAEFKRLAAS